MAPRQIPQSADLRGGKSAFHDCDHIGPSTLKAIAASIRDVRRQSTSQTSIDPSPLFIQYGELIIAGFAPKVAKAHWPFGTNAESGPGAGLHHGDETPSNGVVPSGLSVAARASKPASPVAANDGPAIGAIDLGLQVAPVTLYHLKAGLAEGLPFSFLFLNNADAAVIVQPTTGNDAPLINDEHAEVYAATAVGYDDQQEAFLVVKKSADPFHADGEIMMLSYAYWTDPFLSQEIWTIWKSNPQICT